MNSPLLQQYAAVAGADVVRQLQLLAKPLRGMQVVHVNSTRRGGGVAEILEKLIPLMSELGIDARWEVIEGSPEFYECTKLFHNALQGQNVAVGDKLLREYERVNEINAMRLRPDLEQADVVIIHDPQPAAMLRHMPKRKGKWIWRCHIDVSHPHRPVWRYLRPLVADYDASVFSLADFVQHLPHPVYLIPPSIDPLSEKNVELADSEIDAVCERFGIDRSRPLLLQVSRYDRFKDPVGVVEAFRLTRPFVPGLQLVLAGGGAADDPEGEAVLREVHAAANGDPDVHVLLLPADANRVINALQRAADVVLQKSLKEGFGLTVTEALWKSKPVIGGDTGGIRLQVVNHQTGFLVSSPEGAALRLRHLLHAREQRMRMGAMGREHVRQHFLNTRQLREYLTLIVALVGRMTDRIELV
ncbi:MAG: glycosyltransferase [Gammaproteobacteria bacterium]|nr:glycosyltransferase [Gammaproteobacteria bacterium]